MIFDDLVSARYTASEIFTSKYAGYTDIVQEEHHHVLMDTHIRRTIKENRARI